MQQSRNTYDAVREHIRPGDGLAFVGRRGLFSWMIRTFTGTPTHVAPVAWIEEAGIPRVVLVEAIEGEGVLKSYASERIANYHGEVYLLTLRHDIQRDEHGIGDWLKRRIGNGYSMIAAILSAPSQWFRIPGADRKNSLFCSKLWWLALRDGGKIDAKLLGRDPSPTPAQLVDLDIWAGCVQLHGNDKRLR